MHRILLVDDEYLEREVLKMILAKKPDLYQVVGEADNGEDALRFVKSHPVDIVIMDIKMPRMTGLDAARLMKEHAKKIGVILVTAYNDFEFAQHAIKYSVDDYLLKPTRPENIFEALASTIKKISLYSEKTASPWTQVEDVFMGLCMKGDYMGGKKFLQKVREARFESYEKEREVLKKLLSCLLKMAENFRIEVEKSLKLRVDEQLKGSQTKDQYFDILELIFEEIFEVIIRDKRVDYAEEMTYALQYIEKNLTRSLTLESAASYMNISPHYFSKLFKGQVGENFIDYVTDRKVERAKELIEGTDNPLSAIAFELGFNEANYFSKVFKKKTGMTPSNFRKAVEEKRSEEQELLRKNRPPGVKWMI